MNNPASHDLSDRLLDLLRRRPSSYFSLDQLSKKLHAARPDIIFAVGILRQAGYKIDADPKGQYRFISAPDSLLAAEITHGLKTRQIGRTVYAYKSVQSTNSLASQLAEVKAPEGSIVVAEAQTRGRGRLGRVWHSPEGTGIYLSIILYPKIDPVAAPGLSIMTALSLAETISAYKPKSIHIKWPNDCLVNGLKVAGILTELSAEIGHVNHVVIGVGINVNHRRRAFPPEIAKTATSLRSELKKDIGRVDFLKKFLLNFEKDYRRFIKSGLRAHRAKIMKYSNLIGHRVSIDMSGKIISGKAVNIDDNGSLVLETADGRHVFNAGEVTVLKKK